MSGQYKIIEESIRKDIVDRFKKGNNLSKIATDLNMNRRQIRKVLVENGLYKVVTHEDKRKEIEKHKELILELYESKNSIKKIKQKLQEVNFIVDLKTLKKFIEENGMEIKRAKDYNRKFTSDDNCFSEYNMESCYWGGVLASDGCVFSHGLATKENNYVTLGVSVTDIEMVERFKAFTKYTGKLYLGKRSGKNHKDCIEARINNVNIVRDLEKNFNITDAKSYTYIPPEIPNDLKKYFILGLLDGDGCITYYTTNTGRKHFSIAFVGTKESCEYIMDFFGVNVKLFKRHKENDKNNFSFVIQGNIQIYKILSTLYDESIKNLCLKRKYNKFLELKEQIDKTYNSKIKK